MERIAAQNLIENTFNFPFDEEKFRRFARNLLQDIDESTFDYKGNLIPKAFQSHISQYKRVGKFADPNHYEIDVLVVKLKEGARLDYARTLQRNFIANYLDNKERDAAIVAFRADNPDDWRFSFIRMEYREKVEDGGKVKVEKELTPAKRYSFLVGKNEPNHTAQQQLVQLLEKEDRLSIDDIEKAFSVEQVTREFYNDYRSLFELFCNDLDKILKKDKKIANEFSQKNIEIENFSKKLMGQIVFLYFLQKKGWLGVGKDVNGKLRNWGDGPKNFFQQLYRKAYGKYENFFNDVLEPLFYEALAHERDDDYWHSFDCRIPFLNGGLFEPINGYNWREHDILLDNELFGKLIEVFDRYNFTVREDDPLDKEVAVDPEMLGQVFENLLPENLRKGKGAFYTPRTIVHYICQESLIEYLNTETKGKIQTGDIENFILEGERYLEEDNMARIKQEEDSSYKGKYQPRMPESIRKNARLLDDKLKSIKVCDLAIGSGAFPLGMLHEIVKARNILTTYIDRSKNEYRSLYELKRHCIQESIYGVDIDPGAIDIAKLRLWLSLVVDEENYKTIKPLPNLDYKIMQGDSLIEHFRGIRLTLDQKDKRELGYIPDQAELFTEVEDELQALITGLHEMQNTFFNARHASDKQVAKRAVEDFIIKIFDYQLEKQRQPYFAERKRIETDAQRFSESGRKQFKQQEFEKLDKKYGFNLRAIEKELREMTTGNKNRSFFPWRLYFADVFGTKGGFDVVIGNPPYVQLQKLHEYADILAKQGFETYARTGDLYGLFYEKGIGLLRPKGVLAFITSNKWMRAAYGKTLRKFFIEQTNPLKLIDFAGHRVFETATVDTNILLIQNAPFKGKVLTCVMKKDFNRLKNLSDYFRQNETASKFGSDSWIILNNVEIRIKEKIERIGIPLKDWDIQINYGIKTGFNGPLAEGGCFIITQEKRDELIRKSPKAADIIRPILRGRDVQKYRADWQSLYIIASHNGYINSQGEQISPVNIDKYPVIKQHLEKYWNEIRKRQDQGITPYNLRSCVYMDDFFRPKIVWKRIGSVLRFSYDESGVFCLDSTCFATGKDMKFLVGYLNSTVSKRELLHNAPKTGTGDVIISVQALEPLKVPMASVKEKNEIAKLVDKCIFLRSKNLNADIYHVESKIDKIIYDLYGFTKEEIDFIQKSQ
jgi:adenine-specific DNA-methyltransferase